MVSINKLRIKQSFAVIISILFVMLLSVSVKAATQTTSSYKKDNGDKIYVIDDADILTDSEEQRLEEKCKRASDNCKIDFVIITQELGLDYSPLDNYVRDILEREYGYNETGENCDAACYVIDMVTRADRIVTSGRAKDQPNFTQNKLDKVRESAEECLTDRDYYEGCVKYINGMEYRLNTDIWYRLTRNLGIKLLISIVITVVVILILRHSAKTKITVTGNTYASNHKGSLIARQDTFINTTVVTHTRSSGGSGGGGGGGGNSGSSGGHF